MRITIVLVAVAVLAGCGGGSNDNLQGVAVNQPPRIGAAATFSVAANSAASTTVSVADDRTGVDALTIEIGVSDSTLLPEGSVVISATGAERMLRIAPAIDNFGQAELLLTVADEAGLQSSTELALTVLPLQREASSFSRNLAVQGEFEAPELINAVEFLDVGEDQDFSDLLDL